MTTPPLFSGFDGLMNLSHREGVDIRPTLLRVLADLYVQTTTHSEQEARQFVELTSRLIDQVDDATRGFTPDLVMISAGFDSLAGDPLGGFTLELEHVTQLTRALVERAESWCGGRVVSALEGGYAPDRLAEASVAHMRALV